MAPATVGHWNGLREIGLLASKNPAPLIVGMTLAELERELIRQTLEKTGGSRTQTAEFLGISRRSLHYKLRDLQIKPDRA